LCGPVASVEMVQVAVLFTLGLVPGVRVTVLEQLSGVVPSSKTIVPVGAVNPVVPETVATNVTAAPKVDGLLLPV